MQHPLRPWLGLFETEHPQGQVLALNSRFLSSRRHRLQSPHLFSAWRGQVPGH